MEALNESRAAKQRILDKKNEENVRAMTHGIVIPGKENANSEFEDDERRKNTEPEEA